MALAFVGSDACRECHADAYGAWLGSHHEQAMQPAAPERVLGDFEDARHELFGEVTRFTGGRQQPTLELTGEDRQPASFPVTHVFGVDPLQQYLAEFPRGRYQVTTVAWDSRAAGDGGQRWFSVYGDEPLPPGHPLHWTGELQNWNSQCAECHSTGLRKNYDAAADRYDTTWSEISVGCEACHGRGSRHVDWAADPDVKDATYAHRGLELALGAGGSWIHDPATGIARREPALTDNPQPEACGRCHARRGARSDDYRFGRHLLETHRPALIEEGLYFPDGQILDEVYVYGSFLQSRMHRAGVTCSDCHDPHSAELRYDGDAVCAQCHLPSVFAATEHTKHPENEVACVDCHMTERLYMVVDGRRDHSFRVPRPDLSVSTGSPNACTRCHVGETDAWAAQTVAGWFPEGRHKQRHFGEVLAAAWRGEPGAATQLALLAGDHGQAPIVRASAAYALRNQPFAPPELTTIERLLGDPEPLVRFAALEALEGLPADVRAPLALPLLDDPVRGVRISAASVAAPADGRLPAPQQQSFDRAAAELMAAERYNFDREAGHLNFGNFLLARGQAERARRAFRAGLERYPESVALTVNLADALRVLGRDSEAVAMLETARAAQPEVPSVREALALAYVRADRHTDALPELRTLVELEPDSPRAGVLLVLALDHAGEIDEARKRHEALRERFPDDPMVRSLRLAQGGPQKE